LGNWNRLLVLIVILQNEDRHSSKSAEMIHAGFPAENLFEPNVGAAGRTSVAILFE
jgi:hypothetical protein